MNTLYPETKHILDALGDIIDPRHNPQHAIEFLR